MLSEMHCGMGDISFCRNVFSHSKKFEIFFFSLKIFMHTYNVHIYCGGEVLQ
jgi:hypothetical protein